MKSALGILAVLLLVPISAAAAPAARAEAPAQIRSLIAAERQLAADMTAGDPRQSFVERLAAMAVLLRPRPMGALAWLQEHPLPAGRWSWEPVFAEISGAGDLGYTTGPWRFVDNENGTASSGTYVALWRWHPQTGWKLLLQAATQDGSPAGADSTIRAEPAFVAGTHTALPQDMLGSRRDALVTADSSLARSASTRGSRTALDAVAAPDLRVCRSGTSPAVGKEAALAAAPSTAASFNIATVGTRVAASGDLGYTFGILTTGAADAPADSAATWSYVHVWRLDDAGQCRLVLDLAIPAPPSQ